MQTFSKMRRSSTFETNLSFFLIFVLYVFLTDLFVVLPFLLGILFLRFCSSLQAKNLKEMGFVVLCLFWLELDKGIPFGALLMMFALMYWITYFVFFRFFQTVYYLKFFYIFLTYCCFGILCFFVSSHINSTDMLVLFGGYILIEGIVVFCNEIKN